MRGKHVPLKCSLYPKFSIEKVACEYTTDASVVEYIDSKRFKVSV